MPDAEFSWGELGGVLGNAFGGVILLLESFVLFPGLLPCIALGVLLVAPILLVGVVAAVVVGVPVGAVRLGARALRGASRGSR